MREKKTLKLDAKQYNTIYTDKDLTHENNNRRAIISLVI